MMENNFEICRGVSGLKLEQILVAEFNHRLIPRPFRLLVLRVDGQPFSMRVDLKAIHVRMAVPAADLAGAFRMGVVIMLGFASMHRAAFEAHHDGVRVPPAPACDPTDVVEVPKSR